MVVAKWGNVSFVQSFSLVSLYQLTSTEKRYIKDKSLIAFKTPPIPGALAQLVKLFRVLDTEFIPNVYSLDSCYHNILWPQHFLLKMASITVMLGVLILVENDFQMFFWTFVSLFILTKSSIKFFRIKVPNLPETSLILQHCLQTLCLVGTLAYKPSSVRADVSDFDLSVQSTCCHFSHPTSFFCAFLCHEFFCTEKEKRLFGCKSFIKTTSDYSCASCWWLCQSFILSF